jgi:leucyl-tRNA synthetase
MKWQPYPFSGIEEKWQRAWREKTPAAATRRGEGEEAAQGAATRFVFPWTPGSAEGISGSLLRRLILADVCVRFERHRGKEVLFAHAFDGFGDEVLERAAVRRLSPEKVVESDRQALARLERALGIWGDIDPAAAPLSNDPAYYRITQWLFLELLSRNFVFRLWRPGHRCQRCERSFPNVKGRDACLLCGGRLLKKELPEWRADLVPFAERLIADVDKASWPPELRKLQKQLLGRRRGTEVTIPVSRWFDDEYEQVTVFTSMVEAIFGATFLVIAPHHELIGRLLDPAYEEEVERYHERLDKGLEPRISGVRTGGHALNPANLQRIPVIISPLADAAFSAGVMLGIPAHDPELFELARRLKLAIREVIHGSTAKFDHNSRLVEPYVGEGVLTNSGQFSGLSSRAAREKLVNFLGRRGICRRATHYALQSLPLSSSSLWGPPVPLVHCQSCGTVPVPEGDLPLHLPALSEKELAAGRRALSQCGEFLETTCPACGGVAERDTETILPWLGIAWSYLRLLLPELSGAIEGLRADFEKASASGPPPAAEGAPAAESPAGVASGLAQAGAAVSAEADRGLAVGVGEAESEILPEDRDIFEVPPHEVGEGDFEEMQAAAFELPGTAEPAAATQSGEETDGGAAMEKEPARTLHESAHLPAAEGAPAGSRGSGRRAARGAPGPDAGGERGAREAAGGDEDDEDDEADEEEGIEDPSARRRGGLRGEEDLEAPPAQSRLRPFRLAAREGRLPVDTVFAPASLGPKVLCGARFLAKFLYESRQFPVHEPFRRFFRVGSVLLEKVEEASGAAEPALEEHCGGLIERFGADTFRLHLLSLGPAAHPGRISARALYHQGRFLGRIWRQITLRIEKGKFVSRRVLEHKHRLVYKVTERLRRQKFHTAASALREFVNFLAHPETTAEELDRSAIETFILVLSPFAPHLAQELWALAGNTTAVCEAPWPTYSAELVDPPEREFAILIDGKVRDRMVQPAALEPEKLESRALQRERVRELIGIRKVARVTVVPRRLVSIVLEKPAGEPPAESPTS